MGDWTPATNSEVVQYPDFLGTPANKPALYATVVRQRQRVSLFMRGGGGGGTRQTVSTYETGIPIPKQRSAHHHTSVAPRHIIASWTLAERIVSAKVSQAMFPELGPELWDHCQE